MPVTGIASPSPGHGGIVTPIADSAAQVIGTASSKRDNVSTGASRDWSAEITL
jgi:hypothetical protein